LRQIKLPHKAGRNNTGPLEDPCPTRTMNVAKYLMSEQLK